MNVSVLPGLFIPFYSQLSLIANTLPEEMLYLQKLGSRKNSQKSVIFLLPFFNSCDMIYLSQRLEVTK